MWAGAEGGPPAREAMEASLRGRIGPALWERFQQATVAVCGLGGLGSHIALALARAGVGTLRLFDFDRVDLTNLNRQQYKASQIGLEKPMALAENLREVNPYLRLEPHALRLTEENIPLLLQGAQVVCEAFDRPEEKALLTNTVLERLPETYLVAASGMAGLGQRHPHPAGGKAPLPLRRRGKRCAKQQPVRPPGDALRGPSSPGCTAHPSRGI